MKIIKAILIFLVLLLMPKFAYTHEIDCKVTETSNLEEDLENHIDGIFKIIATLERKIDVGTAQREDFDLLIKTQVKLGNHFGASIVAGKAIEDAKKRFDLKDELHFLNSAGVIERIRGRHLHALRFYREALDRIQEADHLTSIKLLNNSAKLYKSCYLQIVKVVGSYDQCQRKMFESYAKAYNQYGSQYAYHEAMTYIESKTERILKSIKESIGEQNSSEKEEKLQELAKLQEARELFSSSED